MTLLLLAIAAVQDKRSCHISNRLICSGWIAGILFQAEESGIAGIFIFLRNGSIPVILLFLLFLMRALGAGDIKLFSVIGGIWDLHVLAVTMLASFAAGAFVSCFVMISNRNLSTRIQVFARYARMVWQTGQINRYPRESSDGKRNVIHFSITILIGFLVAMEVVY